MKSGRITQKQIAEEAGVSQMTVSNILKGRSCGKVSSGTCRRVQKIIAKYNYGIKLTPNAGICQKSGMANRIILLKATDETNLPNELDSTSRSFAKNIRELAFQTAEKYGVPLETQAVSKVNSAVEIDWAGLEHIGKNDRILVDSFWNFHAAVALQKRGCRMAMLTGELFWMHYYAPQLSRFAVFVQEERKTAHRVVSFLVSRGAKRIAVLGHQPFFYEPEHPVRVCYEQSLGLHGLKYRNVILLDHRDNHYRDAVRKAYRENPFDALVLNFTRQPGPDYDPEKDIRENLGLPENVILFLTMKPFFPFKAGKKTYALGSVLKQRVEDAVCSLIEPRFKPGIRYYERQIETLKDK